MVKAPAIGEGPMAGWFYRSINQEVNKVNYYHPMAVVVYLQWFGKWAIQDLNL